MGTLRGAAPAGSASGRGLAEEAIYGRLLGAIFDHRLPPGTKLGEDRLARIFSVSRARIRRVLPRLAQEGVVTLEPNRGAFVAEPTVEEARDVLGTGGVGHDRGRFAAVAAQLLDQARDVFEARRLIEPGILGRLMVRNDLDTVVARLREHVAAETRARAAGDERAIVRLSGAFHMLLADAAGNALLAKTMRELASLTCLIIALYDRPSVPACLGEEHGEIVDLIAQRDSDRAAELMVRHLDHVERNLDLDIVDTGAVDLEAVLR